MVLKNSAIYFLSDDVIANVITEWTRSVRMIDCSVELNRTRTNYRNKYRKEVKLNSTRNRHMELEQNTPKQLEWIKGCVVINVKSYLPTCTISEIL